MELLLQVLRGRFQSTHPVGGGTRTLKTSLSSREFQSTHPVGGGTLPLGAAYAFAIYFNPPTPWGVGPRPARAPSSSTYFNPPTPWGVGLWILYMCCFRVLFQSTHPVGGGTIRNGLQDSPIAISIHPPRGGWDVSNASMRMPILYFNPPTPWGVGQMFSAYDSQVAGFQSTHPVGGGTYEDIPDTYVLIISIHPPRGGWDMHPW